MTSLAEAEGDKAHFNTTQALAMPDMQRAIITKSSAPGTTGRLIKLCGGKPVGGVLGSKLQIPHIMSRRPFAGIIQNY